jgi:ribosomal protein S18 acetylase RimI-like enzyme
MRLQLPAHLSEYAARTATPDDARQVAACVAAAYAHYIDRNGLVPGPMRDDYGEVLRDTQVTVVERRGDIVAVLVLKVTDEGFLLDNIAVDPAHQGTGLGRCLLEHAESEARRQGFDSIYLYTQEAMTENLALYEGIGYVEYARRREIGLSRVYLRKQFTSEPARQMLEDASEDSGSANRTVER